ncbi:unnamed protein product [Rotaria sordida]|uniref:Uncharacterized protein n=1 Tax=Rotaria sordida TaxID=392033 RepID=A0A820B9R7_9BILA|nr:unnamed protein product [Rotaria sordida]
MAKLYLATRKYSMAMKNVQQAVEIAQEKLPSTHPHLLEYKETFENIRKKIEDIPNTLNEAEQLLTQHQTIKEEIDRYDPDYTQMKEYGHRVIRDTDTTNSQYIFLRERLKALDNG